MASSNAGNRYLYCFTQSNTGTNSQITEKLKDLSDGITNDPPSGLKGRFSDLKKNTVLECVVGESHVAVLLEDGKVCRMAYSEEMPPLPTLPNPVVPSATIKEKSDDDAASTSSARSRGSSPGRADEDRAAHALQAWSVLRSNQPGSSGSGRISSRGRIWLRRRGGHGLLTRWPVIPASEVPDDLIDQAMSVLQDKSRDTVTRELQRTNLDVNQALNNLLSREDDDGDEESSGIVGLGIPSGELLSLLGSGLVGVADDELDDIVSSRLNEDSEDLGGRESRVSLYEFNSPLAQNEMRSLVNLADGAAGGGSTPTSWDRGAPPPSSRAGGSSSSQSADRSKRSGAGRKSSMSSGKKKEEPSGPLLHDGAVESWGGLQDGIQFKHIAGAHSELYAVDYNGRLHGWPWSSHLPTPKPHPLEKQLGLEDEKIKLIAGKFMRISVLTESGKLATWMDPAVRGVAHRLEMKAQFFPELAGETIVQLHVSEVVSAVVTESSKIFWWGILPFNERKQSIVQNYDKVRQFRYRSSLSSSSSSCHVVQGSRVCVRSSPIYGAGGKVVHMKGTHLQCGVLQSDIVNPSLTEKCSFKVINGREGQAEKARMEVGGASEKVGIESPEKMGASGVRLGSKRTFSEMMEGGADEKMEEWSLRDVVFVDHVTNLSVGVVVKLDGNYVAVHYPAIEGEELSQVDISKCRLLLKDEMVLASEALDHLTPYYIQSHPKKLRPPSNHTLLSLSCDLRGVHALFSTHNQLRYVQFSLETGRFHLNSHFSELSSKYLIKQGSALRLIPVNQGVGLIIDKNGSLFPISKNTIGNVRDLQLLNLPPVTSVSVGVCSNRNNMVGVVTHKQVLMPAILRCDVVMVQNILKSLKGNPALLTSALKEHCSGGSNIFHVLTFLGKPQDPVPTNTGDKKGVAARTTPRGGMLRAIMKQAMAMASGSSGMGSSMDWSNEEIDEVNDSVSSDPVDIVALISSLDDYHGVLTQLLQEKNLEGYTPFMTAVVYKAYCTARMLLDLAEVTSRGQPDLLLSMLYPSDSHLDDNPIFILCRNDPCSFTWTGESHVQQDIFECRTCNLTGTLCCCMECAYTCHRGHDCGFKRSSPKAYCDCWQGSKCHALATGGTYERKSLLSKLLGMTELGVQVNSRQQHLLGVLAATVVRQQKEQNNYTGSSAYRSSRSHVSENIPVYDLPPPKFAQKALAMVLENWACVRAQIMCDAQGIEEGAWPGLGSKGHASVVSLDSFVYLILTKLSLKILDNLLTILVAHIGPECQNEEGVETAGRFVRSVVRVYTICHLEQSSIPTTPSILTSSKRKPASSFNVVVDRARRVFSSLASVALKQMIPLALALMCPVSTGIARAVDSQCMSDRHETCEEMFRLPPISLLRTFPSEEEGSGEGSPSSADPDTESELGDGEEDSLPAPLENSGLSAAGANLLYLSDQESSDGEELDSGGDDMSVLDYRMEEEGLLDLPSAHQRITHNSHWALPTPHHTHSSHRSSRVHHSSRLSRTTPSSHRSLLSMGTSASLLSKAFCLLIRQVTDTLDSTRDILTVPTPPYVLRVAEGDPDQLYAYVWEELRDVWAWLFRSMDVLESQLRFGSATCRKLIRSSTHQSEPASSSSSELLQSRRDLFGYMLTLLRGQFQEHGGILPAVDVASMEHLAWTLDSLIYLLQHARPPAPPSQPASAPLPQPVPATPPQPVPATPSSQPVPTSPPPPGTPVASAPPLPTIPAHKSPTNSSHVQFFRRSDSVVCLGSLPLSPFDPLAEALPLAEKPHLLDGTQDKEVLFGYQSSSLLQDWPTCHLPPPPIRDLFEAYPGGPGKVWPRQSIAAPFHVGQEMQSCSLLSDELCGWDNHKLATSVLMGRWGNCVKVFTQAFMDSVGKQKHSILSQKQHFKHREKEFRRDMDYLRGNCHKEVVLEVDRSSNKLLPCLFSQLNSFMEVQSGSPMYSSTPFCVHRVKVTFTGEPGEGSGVLRSLFTAVGEAACSDQPVPAYELLSGREMVDSEGKLRRTKNKKSNSSLTTLGPPLFYQPGKAGHYAPRVGQDTPIRLNAYRNIGRIIGLSLLHVEIIPLPLCRHVFKFMINRTVSWHDMAFFDAEVYEGLRKMIVNSREANGRELMASVGVTFSVQMSAEEGGRVHELVEGGASIAVTPDNVYEYVKKYAEWRMTGVCWSSLNEMRAGLQEVVPKNMLASLTAEDLRLILCGSPSIDMDVLRSITVFDDESHKEMETLARFKGWFWSVLERMTQHERQELLYFWSSSPVLPASMESYQPRPSVTIRPPDDQQFPTANTCISRLYLPLYTSKSTLRSRLLTAIKTKMFGFV